MSAAAAADGAMVTGAAGRWRRLLAVLAAIAALGVLAAACGPATSGAPAAGTAGNGGTTIRITTRKSVFDRRSLTAPAGTITIKVENRDKGIPHNIHVFKGTDASGPSVGATAVEPGPVQQTLTLKLSPGTYYYHCDVHPATMTGILTVT